MQKAADTSMHWCISVILSKFWDVLLAPCLWFCQNLQMCYWTSKNNHKRFQISCLTYLRSAFKVSRKKDEKFQKSKISPLPADLLCTANRRNRRKAQKTWYYYQVTGWIAISQSRKKFWLCKISKKMKHDNKLNCYFSESKEILTL